MNEWSTALQNASQPIANLSLVSEEEGIQFICEKDCDVVFIDGDTVNDLTGLVVGIRRSKPAELLIVAFQSPSWRKAREVIMAGARDCIAKTTNTEHILQLFKRIEEILNRPK